MSDFTLSPEAMEAAAFERGREAGLADARKQLDHDLKAATRVADENPDNEFGVGFACGYRAAVAALGSGEPAGREGIVIDGKINTPGCTCPNECEFPCWQRVGLDDGRCACGCDWLRSADRLAEAVDNTLGLWPGGDEEAHALTAALSEYRDETEGEK